jgi:hypothetical protein
VAGESLVCARTRSANELRPRSAFGHAFGRLLCIKPLTGPQWLLAVLAAVALLAAWELGKLVTRRSARTR